MFIHSALDVEVTGCKKTGLAVVYVKFKLLCDLWKNVDMIHELISFLFRKMALFEECLGISCIICIY